VMFDRVKRACGDSVFLSDSPFILSPFLYVFKAAAGAPSSLVLSAGAVHKAPYYDVSATVPNSIVLNALDESWEASESGFFVKPVREDGGGLALYYDRTSGEITYKPAGARRLDLAEEERIAQLEAHIVELKASHEARTA
jgi:hypothetical protein